MPVPIQKESAASKPATEKLRQRSQGCFERGTHLAAEKQHDYAHSMFVECVILEPSNLTYVEAMLKNLQAKFPTPKKRLRLFGKGTNRELKKRLEQNDWKGAFRHGLDLLKEDPWDTATLRGVAEACAGLHFSEVELAFLRQALTAAPKDIDVNRHCAKSLARIGQFGQAIACWHRVELIRGKDDEAAQMIGKLTEMKILHAANQSAAEPKSSKAVSSDSLAEGPQRTEMEYEVVLTPRQRLENAIEDDPYDISNYLDLATFLLEDEQFDGAERILSRGISVCGEHTALMAALSRVQAARAAWNLAEAEARQRAEAAKLTKPIRIPWLELALGVAAIALLFQFFPDLATAAYKSLDVRKWSRTTWFVANLVFLLIVIGIRFAPTMRTAWTKRLAVPRRREA